MASTRLVKDYLKAILLFLSGVIVLFIIFTIFNLLTPESDLEIRQDSGKQQLMTLLSVSDDYDIKYSFCTYNTEENIYYFTFNYDVTYLIDNKLETFSHTAIYESFDIYNPRIGTIYSSLDLDIDQELNDRYEQSLTSNITCEQAYYELNEESEAE